ncbi:glycosyltransferase [Microbacterium sp. P05]|uniref:glycosyltransferase n=1 Tax=Microbacterium sp. P05 TaxID=3366948 RepID=UPI003745E8AD
MFPEAWYLVLSSRLVPGLDGGYTVATLARSRHLVDAGAETALLTVDPGTPAAHAEHRDAFVQRGEVDTAERMRNLFDEASAPEGGAAPWLREAAHAGAANPELEYRTVADAAGRPVAALPVIVDDPDWHLTREPIVVFDAAGEAVGVVDGFGALYRAWLEEVVRRLRAQIDRPVVLISESRQLGELLAGWSDPEVRIVHAVHTIHLEPPYTADAPLNGLWSRWFAVVERFDAVLWPTASQRADVIARFGESEVHVVAPHGVTQAATVVDPASRVAGRVVVLGRLAPGKRVDLAIRAFCSVVAAVPSATLDIYGDGAERARLQALIDDLDLGSAVTLRGVTDDPGAVLDEASVYLSTSAFEGQGLALAEALAHGTPAVAFDIRYGPSDMLAEGGGVLVSDGDVDALAAALIAVLGDTPLRERLSAEAVRAAANLDPHSTTATLASVVRDVLARPSRRT